MDRIGGNVVVESGEDDAEVSEFLARVSTPLLQSLVGALGRHRGHDAHAHAMAWGWEHAARVMAMDSPVGYLYRVGCSGVRDRRRRPDAVYATRPLDGLPDFEPALPTALAALPEKQRQAVFLVVGCGWTHAELARVTGRSEATVRGLVVRGMRRLRRDLHVEEDP